MSAAQIIAAALAAVLAAGALALRGRLGRRKVAVALAAAAALGVYAAGVLSLLPDPKRLIIDVAEALGPWTYALVGALAFLETGAFVGLVVPGETVVIAGGVIAGQGEVDLLPLIGLVWTCAVLGDTASFFLGRRLGRAFVLRHGPRMRITPERLEQVEAYFERHGGKTILVGRFLGLVRALAPFVIGSSGFSYRRFLPYSILGCGLWGSIFSVLGFLFWQSFDRVAALAGQAALGFGIVVALVVAAVWGVRRVRAMSRDGRLAAWLDRQERRPLLGPPVGAARGVATRLRPVVARAWSLELLELTSVLVAAGAGTWVCALYAEEIVDEGTGPTPLDRTAFDAFEDVRAATLTDAVRIVTDLGSFTIVATLLMASSVLLAARGRRFEPVVLLGGFVILWASVQLMKNGFDRPRPEEALVATRGWAFPSGHAAYSTAWVAAGVAMAAGMRLAARVALVAGAIALCGAIGLSRVYLGAHWLSDVSAGWGAGFAVFGSMAALALVIAHIRHNGAPWTSTSPPSRSRSR